MKQQVIQNIYEVLQTMEEALVYLETNDDAQVQAEFTHSREQVTTLLETDGKRPLRAWIDADRLSDRDWLMEVYRVLDDLAQPFQIKNVYDKEFMNLINYIWGNSVEHLTENLKKYLEDLRITGPNSYKSLVLYFAKYPLWGTLLPDEGDYNTLELRIQVLKQRSFEFLWLYKRLDDYLSKRTLWAILMNWAILDIDSIKEVKSPFVDYYDPDIFSGNSGEIFVDVGAFNGDSIQQYTMVYGTDYKKIYAYEISPDSCEQLQKNTSKLHDVIICQKGAGSQSGFMNLVENEVSSANKVEISEKEGENQIPIVRLEDDIPEKRVDFIKMDIEGAEYEALLGCENMIRNQHPKLAICTYHGYEDIWRLPYLIDEMNPNYKFYLRHYGGNLLPTEFVLLCKDN